MDNLVPCIEDYSENRVGCSNPFQQYPGSEPLCTTIEKLRAWRKLIRVVRQSDGNAISNLTGCTSACDYIEYKLSKPNPMEIEEQSADVKGTTLTLRLITPRSQYTLKDQYIVYDGNSLIADIGGYLGLLLGHSLFSIVCNTSDLVIYMKNCKLRG